MRFASPAEADLRLEARAPERHFKPGALWNEVLEALWKLAEGSGRQSGPLHSSSWGRQELSRALLGSSQRLPRTSWTLFEAVLAGSEAPMEAPDRTWERPEASFQWIARSCRVFWPEARILREGGGFLKVEGTSGEPLGALLVDIWGLYCVSWAATEPLLELCGARRAAISSLEAPIW